jgi:Na+-translocating ferredoxin:NAD+ oxidoreductase RnfE subunit
LASARFSFALITALSLLWIYALTALTLRLPFLPRQGRDDIVLFLTAFFGGLYLFILSLVSPILTLDTLFFLILCPICCVSSGVLGRSEKLEIGEGALHALTEGISLSALLLALAMIREPLGYGTLSLPGGAQGIVTLFKFPQGIPLPIRVASASAGAFFLLGYGIALFRRFGGEPGGRE